MSSMEIWGEIGESRTPDAFLKLAKYSFWSLDRGSLDRSAVPVSRAFPNGVNLSGPRWSLREAMVNGVPSDCDRCSLLCEVSTFSISSGLFIVFHCTLGSDGGCCSRGWKCPMVFQLI